MTTRRLIRENGLTLAFLAFFLISLVVEAIAGHAAFNDQQDGQLGPHISLWRYVTSSSYAVAIMENWQSEYLQFTLFILLTVWLVQKGSPESKELQEAGRESDEDQQVGRHADRDSPRPAKGHGLVRALYENSLLIVMAGIWFLTWLGQSISGVSDYNFERLGEHRAPVGWIDYLGSGVFWEQTMQNWQSEFLAVGSMAILAVYLRQRGSPESKPVGAAHSDTGVEG